MKPKPFCELKKFTVPVAMRGLLFENAGRRPRAARHRAALRPNSTLSPGRARTGTRAGHKRQAMAKTVKISNKRLYSLETPDSNPFQARISWYFGPITVETAASETGRRAPAATKSREKRTRKPRNARPSARPRKHLRPPRCRRMTSRLRVRRPIVLRSASSCCSDRGLSFGIAPAGHRPGEVAQRGEERTEVVLVGAPPPLRATVDRAPHLARPRGAPRGAGLTAG